MARLVHRVLGDLEEIRSYPVRGPRQRSAVHQHEPQCRSVSDEPTQHGPQPEAAVQLEEFIQRMYAETRTFVDQHPFVEAEAGAGADTGPEQ